MLDFSAEDEMNRFSSVFLLAIAVRVWGAPLDRNGQTIVIELFAAPCPRGVEHDREGDGG
jgi:hypothetical protein